jgi:hypothetical protein
MKIAITIAIIAFLVLYVLNWIGGSIIRSRFRTVLIYTAKKCVYDYARYRPAVDCPQKAFATNENDEKAIGTFLWLNSGRRYGATSPRPQLPPDDHGIRWYLIDSKDVDERATESVFRFRSILKEARLGSDQPQLTEDEIVLLSHVCTCCRLLGEVNGAFPPNQKSDMIDRSVIVACYFHLIKHPEQKLLLPNRESGAPAIYV